jgi:3-oxoacyl-[acyl-carrier-protein] synthase II
MSVITSLGMDVDTLWANLTAGKSGVGPVTLFDASALDCRIAAEVANFDPNAYLDRKEARRMDRFSQLAAAAAALALKDAGLAAILDPERAAVVIGTGIGGIATLCEGHLTLVTRGPGRVSPFFIPMMIGNIAAGQIAITHGLKGPNLTIVTACAASANAVGEAFRLIREGRADVAICGGAEAPLVPVAFAGFCSMKALTTRNDEPERASRPFDAGRDGFVMAEGAGMLVLESEAHARARGRVPYAEVAGYGLTADAYHMTAPAPEGEGGARAMRDALRDAGLAPEDIGYINAHGTSTPVGDRCESQAIRKVFGPAADRLPVSSTKSMTGHLLGAAGAVELIACVQAIRTGMLPPTINYDTPDPECDLDYVPNRARPARVRAALSNSFGFGGQNCSLIVKEADGAAGR